MSAGYRLSKARTHAKTGHQAQCISQQHGKHRHVSRNTVTRADTNLSSYSFSDLAKKKIIEVPDFYFGKRR